MIRICLCLLIAVTSASVAARDIKMSSANSGSCPESVVAKGQAAPTGARKAPPAHEAKTTKPTVHSDSVGNGRMQSPRWHSFLPGMFR
ncbi:MAG: hypothetical protein ACREPE_00595 [Lysobacter sp.]